jgi:MOSC domain-containing protein YiiM
MKLGEVLSIQIAPEFETSLQSVTSVQVEAGRGLVGDRFHRQAGERPEKHVPAREVTLIEAEALEALAREYGVELSGLESRRNLTTRGVALNHLVGREFRVGSVLLRGTGLCEPCRHLEQMTGKRARAGLVHRGGLCAQILSGGTISTGDPIETM